jgi:murein DD-endopeptidase MepM/ murein hydrolase activator NlpD
MPRARTAAPILLLLAAGAALGDSGWGRDINSGTGARLLEQVRPEILKVLRASEAVRPAAVKAFVEGADATAEAWKRFRNPELKPLFQALAQSGEWHTAHRALFALEYYRDPAGLPRAWDLLFHQERRLREKAAIACIKLWDAATAKSLPRGDARGSLDALLSTEPDFHVRKCMEALRRRMDGRLPMERTYEEFLVKGADGLLQTPFLEGMDKARQAAPGYAAKGVSQAGGPSAMKLPVAAFWTTPLLGFGAEEVQGTSLQPFANPRENGMVHTGLDIGACMDGAGLYAAADGVVKFVHSGSDMGTLLVVEHHLDEKGVVCAVYMHGGDTVFVHGGDRVEAGQLLGTMGMGFSLENGGHFAHLHYGLYPGAFQTSHNYGYKKAADGLSDWLDPAKCIPRWCDGNRPRPDEAPEALVARATRLRKAGWPGRALEVLTAGEKVLKGKPGVEAIPKEAEAWRADRGFQKAMAGEPKVEVLEEGAARAGKKGAETARSNFEALLKEYGNTDLAPRIRDDMK